MSSAPRDPWPPKDLRDRQNPFADAPFANAPYGENPYASRTMQSGSVLGGSGMSPAAPGMVGHVPIVAILMMVQAGLELLTGLLLVGMGWIIPEVLRDELRRTGEPPPWFFLAMYGGMGAGALLGGVLHLLAGIRNLSFRGRNLGVVALIGGMASCSACLCAPTTIAVAIYGLAAYFNPQVVQAFAMGEAGEDKRRILAAFGL